VDSTIDGSVQFDSEVNLETIANKLIQTLFTDEIFDSGIYFENKAVAAKFFASLPRKREPLLVVIEDGIPIYGDTESVSESLGETYFSTLEKLAIKRQLLLTTNANSDVVFTRGAGTPSKLILINKKGSPNNNIQEVTFTQDASQRFFIYSCSSQPTKGGLVTIAEVPTDQLYVQNGRTIDNRIRRVSRKFYFVPENSSDAQQCENRANWERNVRDSRSMKYQALTQGHSYNGEAWAANKLVSVEDEFAGIKSNLLIDRVIYRQTLKGSQTLISALPPNAFTFPRKKISASDNLGDEFLGIPLHVAPFGDFSEKDLEKIFPSL
ncbi:MAG: hypothetical protein JRL30_29485, partial [Deltaproteobacteria bacterium]|nr:hypothetical protein [Deltaproteobacteria bacterium]